MTSIDGRISHLLKRRTGAKTPPGQEDRLLFIVKKFLFLRPELFLLEEVSVSNYFASLFSDK